jgi:hypothetical protein
MKKYLLLILACLITISSFTQSANYIAARTQALTDLAAMGNNCHYNSSRNIYIDNNAVIHIFIFEDGNLLLAGYPTTATEKNKYQIHLYLSSSNTDTYLLDYSGSYAPVLNIENSGTNALVRTLIINSIDFSVIGPFTNNLQLTIKRKPSGSTDYNTLTTTTIQISKTIHVSIGSGLIYTTLKNPSNIRKLPLGTSGDNTLIADDLHGRGLLTLFATYYPCGRNSLMIPEWNFKDRFGIIVGTSIAAGPSNFKDLFLGISYDFSIGGSIVIGGHYGRRQKILDVDYKKFKFGETQFVGDLEQKKYMGWDIGLFFGVQVDSRIFKQLFK